jgi:cell division protein FtsB
LASPLETPDFRGIQRVGRKIAWVIEGDCRGRMNLITEIRARARHVVGPALGICAIGYFAYHLVHGTRGLHAWWELTHQVEEALEILVDIKAEKNALAHRVKLLHPQSLDPDMLDERTRVMLNYGLPNEIVIVTDRDHK